MCIADRPQDSVACAEFLILRENQTVGRMISKLFGMVDTVSSQVDTDNDHDNLDTGNSERQGLTSRALSE